MSYKLVLPPDTEHEIVSYLEAVSSSPHDALAAWKAIAEALAKLELNPLVGERQYGTPFEGRLIHRFVIVVGDVHHPLAVLYKIHEKDHLIAVHEFQPPRL